MGILGAFWHLVNFMLAAAALALLVTAAGRLLKPKRALRGGFAAHSAINFAVCLAVLLLGLVWRGHDGMMMTYAGMVLCSAATQWLLSGAWRK